MNKRKHKILAFGNLFSNENKIAEQLKDGSAFVEGSEEINDGNEKNNLTRNDEIKNNIRDILNHGDSSAKIRLYNSYITKQFFSEIEKYLFKYSKSDNFDELIQIKKLRKTFQFCLQKYGNKKRKNLEPTFIHLLKTALYTIRNFENPSINKIIIALLHDIIEDGLSNFEEIKENFGEYITIGVLAISKKSIFHYYNNIEINNIKYDDKKEGENKEEISIGNNIKIHPKLYFKLKELRSIEYFSRFISIETMKLHIFLIAKEKGIKTDGWDLNELVKIIFDVKFADRCHNLCTQWNPHGIKKIFIKIYETYKYLIPLAEKYNRPALRIMILYIEELYNLEIKKDGKVIGTLTTINWKELDEILKLDFGPQNMHDYDIFL